MFRFIRVIAYSFKNGKTVTKKFLVPRKWCKRVSARFLMQLSESDEFDLFAKDLEKVFVYKAISNELEVHIIYKK